jgi:hypothetical protein
MNVNRPYTFQVAPSSSPPTATTSLPTNTTTTSLATTPTQNATAATAPPLTAAHALQRAWPPPTSTNGIRQEYLVDGWLLGYLALTVGAADPNLTIWQLGQLAYANYRYAS